MPLVAEGFCTFKADHARHWGLTIWKAAGLKRFGVLQQLHPLAAETTLAFEAKLSESTWLLNCLCMIAMDTPYILLYLCTTYYFISIFYEKHPYFKWKVWQRNMIAFIMLLIFYEEQPYFKGSTMASFTKIKNLKSPKSLILNVKWMQYVNLKVCRQWILL